MMENSSPQVGRRATRRGHFKEGTGRSTQQREYLSTVDAVSGRHTGRAYQTGVNVSTDFEGVPLVTDYHAQHKSKNVPFVKNANDTFDTSNLTDITEHDETNHSIYSSATGLSQEDGRSTPSDRESLSAGNDSFLSAKAPTPKSSQTKLPVTREGSPEVQSPEPLHVEPAPANANKQKQKATKQPVKSSEFGGYITDRVPKDMVPAGVSLISDEEKSDEPSTPYTKKKPRVENTPTPKAKDKKKETDDKAKRTSTAKRSAEIVDDSDEEERPKKKVRTETTTEKQRNKPVEKEPIRKRSPSPQPSLSPSPIPEHHDDFLEQGGYNDDSMDEDIQEEREKQSSPFYEPSRRSFGSPAEDSSSPLFPPPKKKQEFKEPKPKSKAGTKKPAPAPRRRDDRFSDSDSASDVPETPGGKGLHRRKPTKPVYKSRSLNNETVDELEEKDVRNDSNYSYSESEPDEDMSRYVVRGRDIPDTKPEEIINNKHNLRLNPTRPLQFWKNERIDKERGVIYRPATPQPAPRNTKSRKTKSERYVEEQHGMFKVHSNKAEGDIRRTVAKTADMVQSTRYALKDKDNGNKPSGEISLAVYMNSPGWKTGVMTIHPGSKKPAQSTKDHCQMFHVTSGIVHVRIHDKGFDLSTNGFFFVPKHNMFEIHNRSNTKEAKLVYFFTSADDPEQDEQDEYDVLMSRKTQEDDEEEVDDDAADFD
jgi:mannose-6-phosphate isomerase-like protein (cupin superfamily)